MSENTVVRKKRKKKRKINKFRFGVFILVILVFAGYASSIVKLKMDNNKLKAQNETLIEKRDKLKVELENVNSDEYIEKRAREQLRLVNPDEILFVFPEDEKDNK